MHRLTLVVGVLMLTAVGCNSTPQSSRIAIEDYQEMAGAMGLSLRSSDVFADRTPQSEPMVISFNRVLNLSTEVMTQSEQWGIIAMIRGSQPIDTLWHDARVSFVIPAQYALDQADTINGERINRGFSSDREVTHVITATFRSIERTGEDGYGRTDRYLCTFEMIDLRTGQPVWHDTFQFVRRAEGSVRD